MSNTKDNVIFQQNLSVDEPTQFPFVGRSVYEVNDRMNGNYSSGQIEFEVNGINSIRWNNYAEAEIHIPITTTLTAAANVLTNNIANQYAVGWKNGGALQLIHSCSLFLDDMEVVHHSGGLNITSVYDLHQKLGPADWESIGPELLYYPDSAESHQYVDADSGVVNNRVARNNIAGTQNVGLAKRTKWAAVAKTDPLAAAMIQDFETPKKSFSELTGTTVVHKFMAVLKLDRLHPVFKALGLIRGGKARLVLQTHLGGTCEFGATLTMNADVEPVYSGMVSTTQYNSFPFMLSRGGKGASATADCGVKLDTTGAISLRAAIGGLASTCRLRLPQYVADPSTDMQLSTTHDQHTVRYEDYTMVYCDINTNDSVTQYSLTASLPNMRRLLICPYQTVQGTGNHWPPASAVSSAPATVSPYSYLTGIQVYKSSVPIYEQSKSGRAEIYADEIAGSGGFAGNLQDGLRTGCINAASFDLGYGFYDIDLCRNDKSDDSLPKSLSITCTNKCKFPLRLVCFIFQEREFQISRSTGRVSRS